MQGVTLIAESLWICVSTNNKLSVQSFCHRPCNNFTGRCRITNFHYHDNKGQSRTHFDGTYKLSTFKNPLLGARFL